MRFTIVFVILSVWPIIARPQDSGVAKQTARNTTAASKHLTVDDVLMMAKAGISDEVIIARLRKEATAFDLNPDDIIRLKKANVSDPVFTVMMDPKAEIKPASSSSTSLPQNRQPLVVQPPLMPGIAGANRSGATPNPGVNDPGDVNDPLVPHDSGIYLYTKDRDGKAKMIVLERAGYQGAKTGGMLASAMTYGIKKTKTRAVIPGPHASIRVSDPSPVFYFYFDDKQAGLGKTYFGVASLSNPNQFVLLKLEVKKSDRETVIGQYSALGMSS